MRKGFSWPELLVESLERDRPGLRSLMNDLLLQVVLTPPGNDTAVDGAWSNNSTLLLATVSDDPAANCSQVGYRIDRRLFIESGLVMDSLFSVCRPTVFDQSGDG